MPRNRQFVLEIWRDRTILVTLFSLVGLAWGTAPAIAQVRPPIRPDQAPPSRQIQPEPELPPSSEEVLPPPEQLIPQAPDPETPSEEIPLTLVVERFEVVGSTVFTQTEFDQKLREKGLIGVPLPFSRILEAADVVTEMYVSQGYITSGAYIPADQRTGVNINDPEPQKAVIQIQVVEGAISDDNIQISGLKRLRPYYIRDRVALYTQAPIRYDRLLEGLQLLRLDPQVQDISAELTPDVRPGQSILKLTVVERQPFTVDFALDNRRSPSVGSFRRVVQVNHANLLGYGDGISLAYTNTDGSDALDFNYTIPINARNGTISLSVGASDSEVIEEPFNVLDITSNSYYFDLSYRQPILQSPSREVALGITFSRRWTRAELLGGLVAFPSIGADADGITNLTALRFVQEAIWRSNVEVIALRSQFSAGLDLFNATVNDNPPDSRFFAWRGQAQWVRLLAPETLLVLRGDVQLSNQSLLSIEQFGLGGLDTVRGYRQDALLGDNGFLVSAEVRFPLVRLPDQEGLLQVAPFVDFGTVWNGSDFANPDPSTLASVGVGLRFNLGDRLSARFDWGIPLVDVPGEKNTWQENGLYFSVNYRLF